jgi:outer membrane protein
VEEGKAATSIPKNRWLPIAGADLEAYAATVNNTSALALPGGPGVDLPRLGGVAYDPTLNAGSAAAWQPYASTLAAVGVQQQLFDFGRTAALIASADAALAADRHDLELRTLDVKFGATVAFMAVLAAHQIQTAAASAVKRAQAQRDQAAALVRAQLRSRIFLDRAQAELSRFQVSALRAESGLIVAQSSLARVVGYERPLLDATGSPPTPTVLPRAERVIASAAENDPDLKALEARIAEQRQTARATGNLTNPLIYASGTVSLRSGGASAPGVAAPSLDGFLPQTPNWDVGVVASWPFLDPVVSARARTERQHVGVLEAQLAEAKLAVVAAAQDAWAQSDEAERAIPELEQAFASAQQNYDQASVRFTQGLGTTVEIADAETLLTNAEVELAEGQFAFQRSRARVERVMAGGL